MIRFFTWKEFDHSVDYIADQCNSLELSGIYGIPRGGLCLAVALSHKLNLQTIDKPIKDSLIVDDIYETGFTLKKFKDVENATFFVLFSKTTPSWWNTVNISDKKEWIVFPWENQKNARNERGKYLKKRGVN